MTMSDYLWDKTGEPDAETERLENLLGQLRFQPTPFDLPAELPAREFRAARGRSVLSWPRLAVAASITLAALAGAWLVFKQQTGTTNDGRQVVRQDDKAGAGENRPGVVAPQAVDAANGNGAADGVRKDETPAAVPPEGRETRREERVALPPRPRVPDIAESKQRSLPRGVAPRASRGESARATKRRDNPTPPHAEPARREETARLTAEREAAEKVLYALRVTSEKLSYARQQVRGAGRGEENR